MGESLLITAILNLDDIKKKTLLEISLKSSVPSLSVVQKVWIDPSLACEGDNIFKIAAKRAMKTSKISKELSLKYQVLGKETSLVGVIKNKVKSSNEV